MSVRYKNVHNSTVPDVPWIMNTIKVVFYELIDSILDFDKSRKEEQMGLRV